MGQRWPVGCVALEITQRCNLDCTLCYLSEHSEAVHDLPLEEVLRRIDQIRAHYGSGVDVQVTGGDPTLRRRDELIMIIERLAADGQRPTLMTNGIKADRKLLTALAGAGLYDVAFHVDTTQERKGYPDEVSLNELRRAYVEAARGLGLSVMFNTTVHGGNIHEVPALVRFFARHADVVRTASFQLQADTGRGVVRDRPGSINMSEVWQRVESGLGAGLNPSASLIGHPHCSRYGLALLAGEHACDAFDEPEFIAALQQATRPIELDRRAPTRTVIRGLAWAVAHPSWMARGAAWIARKAWALRLPLLAGLASGGPARIRTLSLVVHDFMHAGSLERDRIEACVFKVMTGDGPVSMCLHNAKRDEYILAPVPLADGGTFHPLAGRMTGRKTGRSVMVEVPAPTRHGLKRARGRTRRALLDSRRAGTEPPIDREGRRACDESAQQPR